MKSFCLPILCLLFQLFTVRAQAQLAAPSQALDFWLGEWRVSWWGADSSLQEGTNRIVKILDGTVIEEQFEAPGLNFRGKSLSVYHPKEGQWRQAWVDNQGGFISLTGNFTEEKKIFQTSPDAAGILWRMVFLDIQADSFRWEWERSADDGKSWETKWQIFYHRK